MKAKVLSIILTVAVLFGVMQTAVFAVDAEDEISVFFSATSDDVIVPLETLEVYDGIAEDYGYTVSAEDHNGVAVDGITVLDVLVAAHAEYYGADFTADTAADYLVVSGGFLQKAFGEKATASGFTINNEVPHDDIMTAYGYTGYASDTSRVEEDDFVSFFFYQDTFGYTDVLASFDTQHDVFMPGDSATYTLTGYYAAWYGCADAETIANNTQVLSDIDVFMKEVGDETFTQIGTTDENGQITIDFENEGDYILYATGETETGCPVIYTWSIAYVVDYGPIEPSTPDICSILEKVVALLGSLTTFICKVINSIYRFISDIFRTF